MRSTELGAEYEELAYRMVDVFDGASNGIFLYAELQPGVVSASIFRDLGERIIYRHPGADIGNVLEEIWGKLEESDRWQNIRCTIKDGHFNAKFGFPDEVDSNEHVTDRRPRVLKEIFGDRSVDYSNP